MHFFTGITSFIHLPDQMSIISFANPGIITSNSPLTLYKSWEAEPDDPIGIQVI